jgi:hypothetical protein
MNQRTFDFLKFLCEFQLFFDQNLLTEKTPYIKINRKNIVL